MNYGIGGKISLHLDTFDKVENKNEYDIFNNCIWSKLNKALNLTKSKLIYL